MEKEFTPLVGKRPKIYDLLPKIIIPIAIMIIWVVISQLKLVRPIFLPTPQNLWNSLIGMGSILPGAMLTTITMTLSGFAIGVVFGTASGLVMAYSKTIRDLLGTIFDFMRPVLASH
jgi:ABC-type nitrate/sulfonate/bicarbonate transport system permease component